MNLHTIQPDAHIHYHDIFSDPYRRHVTANFVVAAHSDDCNVFHLANSL